MSFTSRAWQDMSIVIFSRTPLQATQLEVQIAEALPRDECYINSFSEYNQALDFCTNSKNVGFFLVVDDTRAPFPADIFANFASPFNATGIPAFGAVLYEGSRQISGLEQLVLDRRLIAYLDVGLFASIETCTKTLGSLWNTAISMMQDTILSRQLQESIISCASEALPPGSLDFYDRSLTILSSNLNLSWKDMLQLRWSYAVHKGITHSPRAFSPHSEALAHFLDFDLSIAASDENVLRGLADKSRKLSERLHQAILLLDRNRLDGSLPAFLASLSSQTGPQKPAIVKAIQRESANLLQIGHQWEISA